ncbi:MAG: hypothetical protein J2P47_01290 [Acetobacteraceae bacterium]|nr:hypothetical protein [Acetobacteraceae bacterium]
MQDAPGWPGHPAPMDRERQGRVGTALSRVWFTIGHGILDEVWVRRTRTSRSSGHVAEKHVVSMYNRLAGVLHTPGLPSCGCGIRRPAIAAIVRPGPRQLVGYRSRCVLRRALRSSVPVESRPASW